MQEYRICPLCNHPNDVTFLECVNDDCNADLSYVFPTTLKEEVQEQTRPQEMFPARGTVKMSEPRLVSDRDQIELTIPLEGCIIGRMGTIRPEYFDESDYVSKEHARITYGAAGLQIMDLGSMNGTKVNGSRLEPHKPYPLENGDKLLIANLPFTFHE